MNIRAEEIVEGNGKLTLGLIWTIILNFQVFFSILIKKICVFHDFRFQVSQIHWRGLENGNGEMGEVSGVAVFCFLRFLSFLLCLPYSYRIRVRYQLDYCIFYVFSIKNFLWLLYYVGCIVCFEYFALIFCFHIFMVGDFCLDQESTVPKLEIFLTRNVNNLLDLLLQYSFKI